MTNQRFRLSRVTIGGLLLLAACSAYAQDSARNPNPFQAPQVAAAPSTASSTPMLPPATTARQAADTGPLTLPPPIPVPLEKSLPKLASQPAGPVASAGSIPPPPPTPSAKKEDEVPVPAKAQASAASVATPKVRAFLPREKIEANRARCQVSFKGRTLVQLAAGESEQLVQMTGAAGCLTAISADTDWLDAEYQGNNELMLLAHANTGDAARRGKVTVVTPNQTFVLTVRQAAEAISAPKEKAPKVETAPGKAADVPVSAVAPVEPEYDAGRARLADVGEQTPSNSFARRWLAARELDGMPLIAVAPLNIAMPTFAMPSLVEPKLELLSLEAMRKAGPAVAVDASSLPKAAMPQFDLPDVQAPALELRSLALLQQRASPVIAEVVPSLNIPTPHFELPEVRGSPLELKSLVAIQKEEPPRTLHVEDLAPLAAVAIPLPEIAEQPQPLKSLAALRDRAPSVATLSPDQLQTPTVAVALPPLHLSVPKVVEPAAPTLAQQANPAVDVARAKTILAAVFSATQPTFDDTPAAEAAKPALKRPAYVPADYVTLDEYTPAPAGKANNKPAKKQAK
jgi:hypothetical protein